MSGLRRRSLLAGAASLPLLGCEAARTLEGGWVGDAVDRGHRLREITSKTGALPAPAAQRRTQVLVVGAGISGLACARALMRKGIEDLQVIDLEAEAGGNSRGHAMAGLRCPLGAHYVPVPGPAARETAELFEAFGLSRREQGRIVWDERQLCFSPQERLFIDGHWHDGLLPPVEALPAAERAATLAQYRRFSALLRSVSARLAFAIPTARAGWSAGHDELDAITLAAWLAGKGLDAPALRWYLDYCCRDDYGAGTKAVSAWAGLHYFASRHGFRAPGEADNDTSGLLTWPEGNAQLAERLARPLGDRLLTGRIALRVDEGRHAVSVDVMDATDGRVERWEAKQVVLAVPLFVAARLLASRPSALEAIVPRMPHAPWLVANLLLDSPLTERAGAPLSWDNVLYRDAGLGYVDAMHQSLRSSNAGPTVLTAYVALGGDDEAALKSNRASLLADPWKTWAKRVTDELSIAHPDLTGRTKRIDLMRYGHAMCIPAPGLRGHPALRALAAPAGRIAFAHTDLSGYSIFEEALYQGQRAADQIYVQ